MRVSGNTPYIRTPRVKKRSSKLTLILLILTVVIPPLGLLLLWRIGRCPLRGKVLISLLGLAVMVMYITLYIGNQSEPGIQVPYEYHYMSVTPEPTIDPSVEIIAPPPAQEGAESTDVVEPPNTEGTGEVPENVVPANPAG